MVKYVGNPIIISPTAKLEEVIAVLNQQNTISWDRVTQLEKELNELKGKVNG